MTSEQMARVLAEEMVADIKEIGRMLRIFRDRYTQYGKQFSQLLPQETLDSIGEEIKMEMEDWEASIDW